MDKHQSEFINFLLKSGALRVGGDYSLKSKRISPWFINVGDFNDGESTAALGRFYADSIMSSGEQFDLLYGIPEKGNALAVATAIGLMQRGKNVPWFFTRKIAKEYGEATNLSPAERIKALVVGRAPKNGQTIAQLDDVFTAGDAKYQAREVLKSLGDFNLPLLAIAVDRQEVGIDGRSAIEEYEQKTGTRVVSIVNALDVYHFLRENAPVTTPTGEITKEDVERMRTYLRVYGTQIARTAVGSLEQRIIARDKSVIPACDVSPLEVFEELVRQTADVEGIGGYKVGFELGLGYGLGRVVEAARKHTTKPIIYDHQKAGTDIPDTGKNFAEVCKKAGVDAVIFFPQSGPETERAWIYHALDRGLKVIVGGRMTHPAYAVSEGGFITDEGALEMYRIAARAGIDNFVVPGNKPDVIRQIKEVVEAEGAHPVFYAPGFIAQGGSISDAAKVAGDRFHGIVGRGIYQAQDKKAAAIEHTSQL
ncbi:orotidine 5'-phosphate decarboxylase [Candidatus Woesearchaeota archaeon]|nr:orotidine 5'-phosphate decarboxylase [Candidatus Woesearchaeota archaeon]